MIDPRVSDPSCPGKHFELCLCETCLTRLHNTVWMLQSQLNAKSKYGTRYTIGNYPNTEAQKYGREVFGTVHFSVQMSKFKQHLNWF